MQTGELSRGPASSRASWSTANSLIDQNAALWASLRPPARPSWPVLVRQRVSELSLAAVGERLSVLPRWFDSRQAAQRWLLSATAGILLGVGLGLAARFSDSPPELEDPPFAAEPAAAPPVLVPAVVASVASPAPSAAVEDAPASPTPDLAPNTEPDAPKLADATPTPPKRAAVSKKKRKVKATSKRRAQKAPRKSKRALTTSR